MGEEFVTKGEETEQLEEDPNIVDYQETGDLMDEEYTGGCEEVCGEDGVECEAYKQMEEEEGAQWEGQQDTGRLFHHIYISDVQGDDYLRGSCEDPTGVLR
ncbi:uncharacterized protein LOC135470370 isoform X3 [Liolophura sinensis]|uniref:uncharacterized protein LOC135470370 isoform X3 n=1 Tax=Liolophura sinensis TaxID=3198878 RepID=UPI0031591E5A